MLNLKTDRKKELEELIKLIAECEHRKNNIIDLEKVNLLMKLEEQDIDVESTKEEFKEILISKLKGEKFYQKLEEIIDSLDNIEEYKNIRQEEDITETLEILKTFQSDIVDVDYMSDYKSYIEYFESITKKLVKDLNDRYDILNKYFESISELEVKDEFREKYGIEI